MKQPIDLEKAAEAEAFGILAARKGGKLVTTRGNRLSHPTPAQARAFGDLVSSLMDFAKKAGAEHRRVKVGNLSVKLQGHGQEEILSVRKLVNV